MANILVQKDANNLIPKLGISAAERAAWAVNYTIYDINSDGSRGAAYGPTLPALADEALAPDTTAQFRRADAAALQALVSVAGITDGWPMQIPYLLASPPTVGALSAGGAATSLVGSVDILPDTPGAFHYFGGPIINEGGSYRVIGRLPTASTTPHGGVECWVDLSGSGQFEILIRQTSATATNGVRLAIQQSDRSWGYATAGVTYAPTSTGGAICRGLITMAAAGRYKIRLEFTAGAMFGGLAVLPADSVTATKKPRKRYFVIGDSYGQTVSDSGTQFPGGDNWLNRLRYLTGYDFIASSIGATGYVADASGASVKFSAHLAADLAAVGGSVDGIIFAGGYNDYNTGGITTAATLAEVAVCMSLARQLLPSGEIIALAPWCVTTLGGASVSKALAVRDGIKSAVQAVGGKFLDLLTLPAHEYAQSTWAATLNAATIVGATTMIVPTAPTPYGAAGTLAGRIGWWVTVVDGDNSETRQVTSMGTSDPRTLTVAALTYAHAAGTPVVFGGPQYITGTGKQGTTAGNGNADRYIGIDGTHPTVPGHAHIAATVANLWSRVA